LIEKGLIAGEMNRCGMTANIIPCRRVRLGQIDMTTVGIETGWRVIQGTPEFFSCTKKIHNGLQGAQVQLSSILCNPKVEFSMF
jgi:hypothetical protein